MHYLDAEQVKLINETVTMTRGLLREKNGLEGALMRPQQAAYYEQADLIAQAALLIQGLAQSHPFQDGNKRTALLAGTTFLELNGYEVQTPSTAFAEKLLELVLTHDVTSFEQWLRAHVFSL